MGVFGLLNILLKKYMSGSFFKRNRDVMGFFNGKKAYASPSILQIDLINSCNLDCIACWCHSPYLKTETMSVQEKKIRLPLKKIKETIDYLAPLGLREVQISGAGEPFMHPEIMDIIKLVKSYDLKLNIITNFTMMDESTIKQLVELKVDYITASVWAGTEKKYAALHPNQSGNMLHHIGEMLKLLHHLKKNKNLPQVKIYNVISAVNCSELDKMLDFAINTKVDFMEFTVVDIIEGATDFLKLQKEHVSVLLEQKKILKERIDYPDAPGISHLDNLQEQKHVDEFTEFGRYMKNTLPQGFCFDGKNKIVTCPEGEKSIEWFCDEFGECAFFFRFDKTKCNSCQRKSVCPAGHGDCVKEEFLSITGFGAFERRFTETSESSVGQEQSIVDSIPCYAGWIYSKITANGDVIPCCKAHKKPMGNIYNDSFKTIWNGKQQKLFRHKGKHVSKKDVYFNDIECFKACDNLGMNLGFHEKIKSLSPNKILALKIARLIPFLRR